MQRLIAHPELTLNTIPYIINAFAPTVVHDVLMTRLPDATSRHDADPSIFRLG